ncbi:hypothetical protein JB92DRAFT_2830193 [Gautieria morchelliformis]|nr:hypothetical protein JB92DRAFT_2830193 [Gautieria morchelliformis]
MSASALDNSRRATDVPGQGWMMHSNGGDLRYISACCYHCAVKEAVILVEYPLLRKESRTLVLPSSPMSFTLGSCHSNAQQVKSTALDSYQNLLFSIARFHEVIGSYPENVTVHWLRNEEKAF